LDSATEGAVTAEAGLSHDGVPCACLLPAFDETHAAFPVVVIGLSQLGVVSCVVLGDDEEDEEKEEEEEDEEEEEEEEVEVVFVGLVGRSHDGVVSVGASAAVAVEEAGTAVEAADEVVDDAALVIDDETSVLLLLVLLVVSAGVVRNVLSPAFVSVCSLFVLLLFNPRNSSTSNGIAGPTAAFPVEYEGDGSECGSFDSSLLTPASVGLLDGLSSPFFSSSADGAVVVVAPIRRGTFDWPPPMM